MTQDNVHFNSTLNVGYDLTYTYGSEDGKKFQLESVKDVNYRPEEAPGDNNVENGHVYTGYSGEDHPAIPVITTQFF